MKWFGAGPFAPACFDLEQAPCPAGEPCAWCEEPIEEGDDGYVMPFVGETEIRERPLHDLCQLRQISGGINHLIGRCTCCGGAEPPDPPSLSKREAAQVAAIEWVRQHQRRLPGSGGEPLQ